MGGLPIPLYLFIIHHGLKGRGVKTSSWLVLLETS